MTKIDSLYFPVILVLIFVSSYGQCLYGQKASFVYQNYTIENGLSTNFVHDILQDQKGYIWLATGEGVTRYNGNEFRFFPEVRSTIFRLKEDSKGRIWCMGFGVLLFIEDGVVKKPDHFDQLLHVLKNSWIHSLVERSNNEIWFTVANPQGRANPCEKRYLTAYSLTPDTLTSHDLYLNEEALKLSDYSWGKFVGNELIYTGNSNIQIIFDKQKETLYKQSFKENPIKGSISQVIQLKDGTFLANSFNEIIHFDSSQIYYYGRNIVDNPIISLFEDQAGGIWIGTYEGVLHIKDKKFQDIGEKKYFPGYSITGVMQDNEGSYWFSTVEAGLFRVFNKDLQWLKWEEGKRDNNIGDIIIHKDEIWASSAQGTIYKVDSTLDVTTFSLPTVPTEFSIASISNDIFTSNRWLVKDGKMEFASKLGGESKNEFHHFYEMVQAKDGTVWCAGSRGLFQVDIQKREILYKSYTHELKERVNKLTFSPENELWLATNKDLLIYKDSTYSDPRIRFPELAWMLTHRNVWEVEINNRGHVFLSFPRFGVIVLMENCYQIIKASTELSSSKYFHLFIENDSTFWTSGFGGIDQLQYNREKGIYTVTSSFSKQDGFPTRDIGKVVVSQDKLWVGTGKGLLYLDLNRRDSKTNIDPPVYFTSIRTEDTLLTLSDSLILSNDQHNISFSFEAVAFNSREDLIYFYRLKGFDNRWRTSRTPEVGYANLPHGDYLFEVQAGYSDQLVPDNPTTINFSILPHFTQTKEFILAIAVGLILLLIGIYQSILWRWNRQNRRKHLIAELKYQALQSQMNPHFIFNSLNSLSYLVKNKQSKTADHYLNRFAGLLRKVLDHIQYNFVQLVEEIELIQDYLSLEQLQFGQLLQFEIEVDPQLVVYDIYIPPMLLQPIVENAIRHGISPKGGGRIFIKFTDKGKNFSVSVEDDGVGRNANLNSSNNVHFSRRSKVGLSNIHERIRNINLMHKWNIELAIIDLEDQ